MSEIERQLREAVLNCGETRYALSQRSGVSQAQLSKFCASGKSLTPAVIERLADSLGFEVVLRKKSRTQRKVEGN